MKDMKDMNLTKSTASIAFCVIENYIQSISFVSLRTTQLNSISFKVNETILTNHYYINQYLKYTIESPEPFYTVS